MGLSLLTTTELWLFSLKFKKNYYIEWYSVRSSSKGIRMFRTLKLNDRKVLKILECNPLVIKSSVY